MYPHTVVEIVDSGYPEIVEYSTLNDGRIRFRVARCHISMTPEHARSLVDILSAQLGKQEAASAKADNPR